MHTLPLRQQDGRVQQLVLRHEPLLPRQTLPLQEPQRRAPTATVRRLQRARHPDEARVDGARLVPQEGLAQGHEDADRAGEVRRQQPDLEGGPPPALHRVREEAALWKEDLQDQRLLQIKALETKKGPRCKKSSSFVRAKIFFSKKFKQEFKKNRFLFQRSRIMKKNLSKIV